MPQAIETRQVVVSYRDEGVQAGYRGITAAGNQAAAATRNLASAFSNVEHVSSSAVRDMQAEDRARRQATQGIKDQTRAVVDLAREDEKLRKQRAQAFFGGISMAGGPLGRLGSIGAQFAGAGAGGPAMLAGAAVAVGAAFASAVAQVGVASVKLLAAELAFATKAALGLVSAGVAIGGAFAYGALQAALQRDTMMRGLIAILGSRDAAKAELDVLKDIAKMPGINLESALRGALQLRAVGIDLTRVNRLLREFANLNALIGGAPDALGRAMLQFSQMAGKGKVTGEEVRALANDLPPLLGAMRKAFGTTSAEDIERLGLGFDVFLERLLAVLEVGPRATSGMMNALVNLKMAWTEMLVAFGQPLLGDATVALFDQLAKGIQLLTPYVTELANTIAARIPEVTKYLEGVITPEAVQGFVRKLLEMGVNAEFWAKSMLTTAADLVQGMGALLGGIISSFTDFQSALNTVAMGTLTVLSGLVTAVARALGATKSHIDEIRAAAQDPSKRSWWSGTNRSTEELTSWADRLESLRNGALATQESVRSLGALLDNSLALARQSGIDKIGETITRRSHQAADAIRRQAVSTQELGTWYQKAWKWAHDFTLQQRDQAKAHQEVAEQIDREAMRVAKLAAAYDTAATSANRYAAQQAADRAQSRQAGEAWANRLAPGLLAAARASADPAALTRARVTAIKDQAEEEIQQQRDKIDSLKRQAKDATSAISKQAIEDLLQVAEARLKWLEQRWRDATQALQGVAEGIDKTVAAERKLYEERVKSAQAARDAANAAAGEAQRNNMRALQEALEESWKQGGHNIFFRPDEQRSNRAPDLAAQVFGNLGLGDQELMVQAQLDQQAQFKDAIFGAAQTAGESLVDTLAQALGVILPREVALQLADQLNRTLEAAH